MSDQKIYTTINEFKQYLLIKESYFKDNDYYIEKAMDQYDDTYLEEIYEFQYPDNDRADDPEHYKQFMYDYFNDSIDDILADVYDVLDNETEIYRSIKISNDWTVDNLGDSNLGVYWTYDKDLAEAHWGHNDKNKPKEVLIVGEILNKDTVNIEETIMANMAPGLGEEEKEIRLIENKYILIKGVEIDDKFIEVNKEYKI